MRKLLASVPRPGCQPRKSTLLRCNQLDFTNTSHLNSKFYWTNNNLNDFASFNQRNKIQFRRIKVCLCGTTVECICKLK